MSNWNPDSRLTPAQFKEALSAQKKKPGGSSPASQLTHAVLAVLHLHGFTCWRQNNAGVWDAKLGVHRANSAKKGISDVIGIYERGGQWAAVEVKVGRDKLSPEQIEFLAGIRKAGGFAFECRDTVDELSVAVKAWKKALMPTPVAK